MADYLRVEFFIFLEDSVVARSSRGKSSGDVIEYHLNHLNVIAVAGSKGVLAVDGTLR